MKTRQLYTELIYHLAPTTHIKRAFSMCGLNSNAHAVVAVAMVDTSSASEGIFTADQVSLASS